MTALWLCLGGPINGRYRPAGHHSIVATDRDRKIDYVSEYGRTIVTIPPRPAVYYPHRVRLPGWTVYLPMYVEARLSAGAEPIAAGAVLPGGVQGMPNDYEPICRWCFRNPIFPGLETCKKSACRANWASVRALDTTTWRGE
jgi:hypothetical protein